jgi:hypothetical protein
MNMRLPLTRALLAAAITALATGAAIAGTNDSQATTDQTRVAVSTQAGTIERVTIEDIDALQPGETRALSTDSGSAATVTRTEAGFTLQIAGENFDVSLPAVGDHLAVLGEGQHLVIDKDIVRSDDPNAADHSPMKKVIVIKSRHGDATDADAAAADAEAQADILSEAMDEEELLASGPGDGKRVMVVRKIRRHEEPTAH